jgi:hypothetical protein
VDDVRQPHSGWALARTVKEAIHILETQPVEEISLDYMIGNSDEENFSPVARHIVSMPEAKRPKRVHIHTASAQGARDLRRILEGHVEEIVRS